MFSAAPESEIIGLIACKTTKTHAPAKMPAGEQGLMTGQRDPETGLEVLAPSASHAEGQHEGEDWAGTHSWRPTLAVRRASLTQLGSFPKPSRGQDGEAVLSQGVQLIAL